MRQAAIAARLLWIVEIKLINIQCEVRSMTCALLQIVAQLVRCVRLETCQKSAMTAGRICCHFPAELCPMQSINLLDMISDATMIYGPRPGACIQAALPFATRQTIDDRAPD